jgi:hypothetical protein
MTISVLETVGTFHVLFIYWDGDAKSGWYWMRLGAEWTNESHVRAQGPFKARQEAIQAGQAGTRWW